MNQEGRGSLVAILNKIQSRSPSRSEVFTVFSLIVFVDFTWILYRMFYQVPSWLFYHTTQDIFFISAYVVAFALLESVFVLGFILLLPLVYPKRFFAGKFTALSSVIVLTLSALALYYQQNIGMLKSWGLVELIVFLVVFCGALTALVAVFSSVIDRFKALGSWIQAFAEWLSVFSLIYVPLSVLGLVIMLARLAF